VLTADAPARVAEAHDHTYLSDQLAKEGHDVRWEWSGGTYREECTPTSVGLTLILWTVSMRHAVLIFWDTY